MTTTTSFFSGSFGGLILYALYALFSQNAVLGRALGASRLTKLVSDEDGDTGIFAVLLLAIQLLSGALGWAANRWVIPLLGSVRVHFRPLILVACTCVVFFAVFFFVVQAFPVERAKRVVKQLPIAAFNCCILGTLLLTSGQSYTFLQTMFFCLGSALGYMLAVVLMMEGSRKLKNADMPNSFRGLPATLVYLGILSLIIYSFTGHGLAV